MVKGDMNTATKEKHYTLKRITYLILSILISSCDPAQEIQVNNNTGEELIISFFEDGNSIHSIKNQGSSWDSLTKSTSIALQPGQIDTIWFGTGTWEIHSSLDSFIKHLDKIEIEFADVIETYDDNELDHLVRNSLTGEYNHILKFNLAAWRASATVVNKYDALDSLVVKAVDDAHERPYKLHTIDDLFSIIQLPNDASTSSVSEFIYVEEVQKELLAGTVHVIKAKDLEQDVIGSVGMLVDASPAEWWLTTEPYKITYFVTTCEKVELWNGLFIGCARADIDLTHVNVLTDQDDLIKFVDKNNLQYTLTIHDDRVSRMSIRNK